MSRKFLIKFGAASCPNDIVAPRTASDWQGQRFTVSAHLPRVNEERPELPETGDIAYLWVHEFSGGHGLTARTILGDVHRNAGKLHFVPVNLELLPSSVSRALTPLPAS